MMVVLRGLLLPLGLLIVLELYLRLTGLVTDSLSPPTNIVRALGELILDGRLFHLIGQTLASAFGGLAIAGLLGFVAGTAIGLFPTAGRIVFPTIEALRPIPSVATIPLVLLIVGFGYRLEIVIVAYAAFWPILILTESATRLIERGMLEVARLLGFGFWRILFRIVLPAALPRLVLAVRLALGVALVVAVTVEIVINPQGIGYALMRSQEQLRPDLMYAMIFAVGFLGWGLNALMVRLERRLSPPAAHA
jgi:ABC-type nitrate/sulfonate/bicarbonate transport system permease component